MNNKERKEKQHIQVFARIRPFNENERMHRGNHYMQVNGKDIIIPQTHGNKKFTFDKVFDMHSKQVDVYKEAISPIIQEVLKGYNCTVFAYGQTGSGKTFTMVGPELAEKAMSFMADSDVGIIPRSMGHIFDTLLREREMDYTLRVSYLEIYNEVLYDLLSNDDKTLRIYEDPRNKSSVQIHGLEEITVYNKVEVYELLKIGSEKRRMAATYMNQQSSRSHSVFTITVHMKETTPEGEELVKTGKLNLVDLAGSENIQRSRAVEQRAREAGNINQSLLTLGRVIQALENKAGHIPYRESKLTRILQDSLGGKTKTTIIATASPAISNMEETLSTLDYAFRARNIVTKPEVNQRLCKTELIKGYLEEIDKLKKDLTAARKGEGFYLNVDSYASLLHESETNKEAYLRTIKECAEFQTRSDELERQYNDLTVVYSASQNDLSNAKNSLQKSKTYLKHLRRDRHIRQELIDKYSETESEFFNKSKEMSIAFDNHIKEHNILCDKLQRFYRSMRQNEDATDFFKEEQSEIANEAEKFYDELHEDLINQLNDTKSSTFKFIQLQNQAITNMEGASFGLVSTVVQNIHEFSDKLKAGQEQRLNTLESNLNLSTETMQVIKEHIEKENSRLQSGLSAVCSHINQASQSHRELFKTWHASVEEIKKDVEDKSNSTIATVQMMHVEANERLAQLSAKMQALKKPLEDAKEERFALQKYFNAYMQKNDQLHTVHNDILSSLSTESKGLNTVMNAKWAEHENVMREQVLDTQNKVNDMDKIVAEGIKLANREFEELPCKLQTITEENTQAKERISQLIATKGNEIKDCNEKEKQTSKEFYTKLQNDLQKNTRTVTEFKEDTKNRIDDFRLVVTNYNNAMKSKMSGTIDAVKHGIEECSSKFHNMSRVATTFISNLKVLKPTGETPTHKDGITYNIPRKVSKKVLQYDDLDLSSISILDESMEQSCGRPSIDFYDQDDVGLEYKGEYVTMEVQNKMFPNDFEGNLNGNPEATENT